jgi:hypothetical protein
MVVDGGPFIVSIEQLWGGSLGEAEKISLMPWPSRVCDSHPIPDRAEVLYRFY